MEKKAIMNTIESLFSGILLFLLLITYLNYTSIKVKEEKININELLYDQSFREAVILNNATEATNICNLYYSSIGVNCTVDITDLSLTTNKTYNSMIIYNILFVGNETDYNPRVARIIFK